MSTNAWLKKMHVGKNVTSFLNHPSFSNCKLRSWTFIPTNYESLYLVWPRAARKRAQSTFDGKNVPGCLLSSFLCRRLFLLPAVCAKHGIQFSRGKLSKASVGGWKRVKGSPCRCWRFWGKWKQFCDFLWNFLEILRHLNFIKKMLNHPKAFRLWGQQVSQLHQNGEIGPFRFMQRY